LILFTKKEKQNKLKKQIQKEVEKKQQEKQQSSIWSHSELAMTVNGTALQQVIFFFIVYLLLFSSLCFVCILITETARK
jgi:hypothetical protein